MINYNQIIIENAVLESDRMVLRPFSIDDINDDFWSCYDFYYDFAFCNWNSFTNYCLKKTSPIN